jgi:hypothetical protein
VTLIFAEGDKLEFLFYPGVSWQVEEAIDAKTFDSNMKPVEYKNLSTITYTGMRNFPDGAGLLEWTSDKIKNKKFYTVITGKGERYQVNTKQEPVIPGEETAMAGMPDDLKELQSSETLENWLSTGQSPMDYYKIPDTLINVKKSVKKTFGDEKWTITRLKNETINDVPCVVFKAISKRAGIPITETTWFYAMEGSVIKRIIESGGMHPSIIIQTRK